MRRRSRGPRRAGPRRRRSRPTRPPPTCWRARYWSPGPRTLPPGCKTASRCVSPALQPRCLSCLLGRCAGRRRRRCAAAAALCGAACVACEPCMRQARGDMRPHGGSAAARPCAAALASVHHAGLPAGTHARPGSKACSLAQPRMRARPRRRGRAQDAGFADAFGAWKFVGTRVDAMKPISLAARTAFAPAPAASPAQLAAAATRVQPAAGATPVQSAAVATPVQRAAAATPMQPAAGVPPVQLVQVSYYSDTSPVQATALATPPTRPVAADSVPTVPAAVATPPTQLAADAAPAQPAAAATPPPTRPPTQLAADAAPAQPAAGAPDRSGTNMDYFQDGQPQALGVTLDGNGSFAWQALDAARTPPPLTHPLRPPTGPPRACTRGGRSEARPRARPPGKPLFKPPCAWWARAAVSGPAPCSPCRHVGLPHGGPRQRAARPSPAPAAAALQALPAAPPAPAGPARALQGLMRAASAARRCRAGRTGCASRPRPRRGPLPRASPGSTRSATR